MEEITEVRASSNLGDYKIIPVAHLYVQHPRWPEIERLGRQISDILDRKASDRTPLISPRM